jgi:hypothetical protein
VSICLVVIVEYKHQSVILGKPPAY